MEIIKVDGINIHERAGPKNEIIREDSNAKVIPRKDDVIIILSQEAIKNASIKVISKPKDAKESLFSLMKKDLSSLLLKRIKNILIGNESES